MTDLTEQWKAGELYYVKKKNGEIVIRQAHLYSCLRTENAMPFVDFEDNDVEKVIAPVPSYDEWQASENYIDYLKQCISVYESKDKQATETSIAYNELLEENTKLKERNGSLNNRDINLCRIANGIRDENFSLKELLKECIPYFNALVEKRLKLEYIPQVYELLTKINEVLK